ncbi:hypothetical protein [Sphingosinicella sp.]|uniref:hypothetical protein n=1 Tax=Sphingosinicella sp. TaxID=1917971 RepID=UPI00403805CF
MKELMHILGGLLAATAAMPLAAQETGTLRTHRSAEIDDSSRDGARRTMEAFAACVVSRQSGRVVALSRLRIDSDQYARVYRNLFDNTDDECLSGSGSLYFSPSLLRGGIFQALYAREFRSGAPTDFSAVTTTGYRQLYEGELHPEVHSAVALEQFGECVSRADAAGVQTLLRQIAGSAGERAAIQALAPRFAACIPRNETIRFSPSVLKGALAEGIYRLSVAAREGAQASR